MKAKLLISNQELEVEIPKEELKKPQKKKQKKTGYERVGLNKIYYLCDSKGECVSLSETAWKADDMHYENANYYTNKTIAENNARADKLMRQLRRFEVEHRGKRINCDNDSWYEIVYNKKLTVKSVDMYRYFGCIIFDTPKAAQLAIDTFYDELIWYFTEYKDSL